MFTGQGAAVTALELSGANDTLVAPTWVRPGTLLTSCDIAHRTPGCPCCAMRLDVIDGVLRAARRAQRPERIFVVADAHEDITTITYTILSDTELARHTRLDGVIVCVDAVATSTRLGSHAALGTAREVEALAVADRVILRRTGELTSSGLSRLVDELSTVNAIGSVWSRDETDPADLDTIGLTELDAWHGAPDMGQQRGVVSRQQHTDRNTPTSLVLRQSAPLDPDAIDAWLNHLVHSHARRLLRMQGALTVVGVDERVCCHAVRSFAMSHSELADPTRSRRPDSLVLVVGTQLDVEELTQGFAETRAQ